MTEVVAVGKGHHRIAKFVGATAESMRRVRAAHEREVGLDGEEGHNKIIIKMNGE